MCDWPRFVELAHSLSKQRVGGHLPAPVTADPMHANGAVLGGVLVGLGQVRALFPTSLHNTQAALDPLKLVRLT